MIRKAKAKVKMVKPAKPYKLKYRPQEDITAYELALALRVIVADYQKANHVRIYEELPANVQRHFERVYDEA